MHSGPRIPALRECPRAWTHLSAAIQESRLGEVFRSCLWANLFRLFGAREVKGWSGGPVMGIPGEGR